MNKSFKVLKNPINGWIADPFLFEYKSKTYIFAERWDYKMQKGVISFCEYTGDPSGITWKDVITEELHMSYPFIWNDSNGIHIMAETSESGCLSYYTAVEFPNIWKKDMKLAGGQFADTTLLKNYYGKDYLFSYDVWSKRLYRARWDGKQKDLNWKFVTKDQSVARPGGSFINEDGKIYRIAQDCSRRYGEAISILKVEKLSEESYEEKKIKRVSFKEVGIHDAKKIIGMHTYNRSDHYEVVDIRIWRFNILDFCGHIRKTIKDDLR